MKIVIYIPEEYYKEIENIRYFNRNYEQDLILDGIPLPKGHGRLGDLDALAKEMENGIRAGLLEEGYEHYGHILNIDDCVECVKFADTIIEADTESED